MRPVRTFCPTAVRHLIPDWLTLRSQGSSFFPALVLVRIQESTGPSSAILEDASGQTNNFRIKLSLLLPPAEAHSEFNQHGSPWPWTVTHVSFDAWAAAFSITIRDSATVRSPFPLPRPLSSFREAMARLRSFFWDSPFQCPARGRL
jgi:hypothetical protein